MSNKGIHPIHIRSNTLLDTVSSGLLHGYAFEMVTFLKKIETFPCDSMVTFKILFVVWLSQWGRDMNGVNTIEERVVFLSMFSSTQTKPCTLTVRVEVCCLGQLGAFFSVRGDLKEECLLNFISASAIFYRIYKR